MTALWTAAEAEAATGGSSTVDWGATGVSIDTRSLAAGELFIALRGPNLDGHDFVRTALERGAAGAMVVTRLSLMGPTRRPISGWLPASHGSASKRSFWGYSDIAASWFCRSPASSRR